MWLGLLWSLRLFGLNNGEEISVFPQDLAPQKITSQCCPVWGDLSWWQIEMLIKDRVERGVESVNHSYDAVCCNQNCKSAKRWTHEEKKRLEMYFLLFQIKNMFTHLCSVFSGEMVSDYRIFSQWSKYTQVSKKQKSMLYAGASFPTIWWVSQDKGILKVTWLCQRGTARNVVPVRQYSHK